MIRAALPVLVALGVLAPACHRESDPPLTPAAGTRTEPPAPRSPPLPESQPRAPEGQPPAPGSQSSSPEVPAPAPAQALTDGQLAGVLATAASNALQQARIAIRLAQSKEVRDYARMLVAHHERSSNDARALDSRIGLVPEDSPEARALRSSNTEAVVALNESAPGEFDRKFIVSQIRDHEKLLALFDTRLIPDARGGELRALLEKRRPMLQSHLEQARALESKLP